MARSRTVTNGIFSTAIGMARIASGRFASLVATDFLAAALRFDSEACHSQNEALASASSTRASAYRASGWFRPQTCLRRSGSPGRRVISVTAQPGLSAPALLVRNEVSMAQTTRFHETSDKTSRHICQYLGIYSSGAYPLPDIRPIRILKMPREALPQGSPQNPLSQCGACPVPVDQVSEVSTMRRGASRYSCDCISTIRDTVRVNSLAIGPSVYNCSGVTAADISSLTLW